MAKIIKEEDAQKTIALKNELLFRNMDKVLEQEKNCRAKNV